MVSRATLEVVWFPEKSCTAFGLLHSSWIPTDVGAMAAQFPVLLQSLHVLSVQERGLPVSAKLWDALFLTHTCRWHRGELKRPVWRQRTVGTPGMLDYVQFQRECLQKKCHMKYYGLHLLLQMGCWGAQPLIWVVCCAGSLELPGHYHCKWGQRLMMSWPMSREVITLCCTSSSQNFNQMQLSSLS